MCAFKAERGGVIVDDQSEWWIKKGEGKRGRGQGERGGGGGDGTGKRGIQQVLLV